MALRPERWRVTRPSDRSTRSWWEISGLLQTSGLGQFGHVGRPFTEMAENQQAARCSQRGQGVGHRFRSGSIEAGLWSAALDAMSHAQRIAGVFRQHVPMNICS